MLHVSCGDVEYSAPRLFGSLAGERFTKPFFLPAGTAECMCGMGGHIDILLPEKWVLQYFHFSGQCPGTSCTQFGCVDADVAIDDKDVALFRLKHILIVKVAEIYFRGGISPVARIDESKTQPISKRGNLAIVNMQPHDKRLFHYNLEVAIHCTSIA